MKAYLKLSIAIGVLALVVPAMALATPGNGQGKGQGTVHGKTPEQSQGPNYTPAPPPQANAFGRICQDLGESKKHVKGEKGTAFSRCVTTLAHAAQHPNQSPGQVCKGKSKKHVKGEKGTAFSRCVKTTAQLRREERRKEREEKQQG